MMWFLQIMQVLLPLATSVNIKFSNKMALIRQILLFLELIQEHLQPLKLVSMGPFTTIDTSPPSGTFSGTLTAEVVGQGSINVRFSNDTGVSGSVNNVGVGDIFIISGQSNASGRGNTLNNYTHATLKAGLFDNDDTWKELADATDSNSGQTDGVSSDGIAKGSPWPLIYWQIMGYQLLLYQRLKEEQLLYNGNQM